MSLHVTMKQVEMTWAGLENIYVRRCLVYEVEGNRPRGRLKKTWSTVVDNGLEFAFEYI